MPPPPSVALASALALALASRAGAIGINLGNVLEAPTEGAWAPKAQEYYFDDYKTVGFTFVRIPVRWDEHTMTAPPYTIDAAFLARVHEVQGWAAARGLATVVNSHHDDWLDNATAFDAALPRFKAIWTQVAHSFAAAPADGPSALHFEVFNEPHLMSIDQCNAMNAAVVPIMRSGGGNNAVRPIYLGGISWMSPEWILSNPDALAFPALPGGGVDPNLRLEVHCYDPYHFCLEDPPTAKRLLPADYAWVDAMYRNISAWGAAHLPGGAAGVYMGEAGCQLKAPSRADVLAWYALVATDANHTIGRLSVWDDDGTWGIYNRAARTWDQGVLKALGLAA